MFANLQEFHTFSKWEFLFSRKKLENKKGKYSMFKLFHSLNWEIEAKFSFSNFITILHSWKAAQICFPFGENMGEQWAILLFTHVLTKLPSWHFFSSQFSNFCLLFGEWKLWKKRKIGNKNVKTFSVTKALSRLFTFYLFCT